MGCTGSHLHDGELAALRKNHRVDLRKETIHGENSSLQVTYAATTMTGWRPKNEDSYFLEADFLHTEFENSVALFSVFDGHGGAEISTFAKKNILDILTRNHNFHKGKYSEALRETFLELDLMMVRDQGRRKLQEIAKEIRGSKYGCNHNFAMLQGSTALVVLITENEIYIANAGDSKAVVYGLDNQILLETVDHRPDHPSENIRIRGSGGKIISGRIQGDLNVSRGFGDICYKNYSNLDSSIVTPLPDINIMSRKKVSHIVMGSDGIWEKPTTIEACKDITNKLIDHNSQSLATEVEKHLNSLVSKDPKSRTGKDNMTSILIRLDQNHSNQLC